MRVLAAIASAILPVLAAAPARADSCLADHDVIGGFGVGTHRYGGDASQSAGFVLDGPGYLVAARFRVACHLAVGGRFAAESELDIPVFGDTSPPDGVVDVTPEVTIGSRPGRLRLQLSIGPALYATRGAMQVGGVGIGADALVGVAISQWGYLAGAVATTADPDRFAIEYVIVLGIDP